MSHTPGLKLRFHTFQRWFRIENRTNIKKVTAILVIFGSLCIFQTMGAPLLGWRP